MLTLPFIIAQADPVSVADFTNDQILGLLKWGTGVVGPFGVVAVVYLIGAFFKDKWPFDKRSTPAAPPASEAGPPTAPTHLSPVVTLEDLNKRLESERAWVKEQMKARADLVNAKHRELEQDMDRIAIDAREARDAGIALKTKLGVG